MAAHLGIRLHEIEISPDVVDMLPRVVDVLDEPIGDPAAINTVLMCQAAREAGVKVLLSGMGADELFGGYRKHLACVLGARYQLLPRPLRTRVVGAERRPAAGCGRRARASVQPLGQALPQLRRAAGGGGVPAQLHASTTRTSSSALLDPELAPLVHDVVDAHRRLYADSQLADHVNRMCLTDSRLFLPGLNLAYTDRSSMSASTEVRVPFVDPRCSGRRSPSAAARRSRAGRRRFRCGRWREDWVPREVVDRPKASFGAPLRAWVTNELGPLIDDVLLDGELVSSGFLRRPPLRQMVADQRSGRSDQSKQLWQLLSMELWYRGALAAGVAPP